MGILKENDLVVDEKVVEAKSGKKGQEIQPDINEFDFLKGQYKEEVILLAEKLIDDIDKVLLGGSISYTFSEEEVGLPGLSFGFRSMAVQEEAMINQIARMNGWDVNGSKMSLHLIMREEILYSLVNYCDFDLCKAPLEKKKERIDRIPSFILTNYVFPKYSLFRQALDVLSIPEVYSFLSKRSSVIRQL